MLFAFYRPRRPPAALELPKILRYIPPVDPATVLARLDAKPSANTRS
jgi:hypothetical protein